MGLFIYNCFLFLYRAGILLVSPWNPKARLWLRGRKNWGSGVKGWADKDPGARVVWMHCASLGEFEQGRPVIEKLKQQYPDCKILLTFFSPSGYEIRKNYEDADIICYLPMDSAANARRFVDMVRPSLVLWVKYEYWYHYITEINKRNIPLLLISGIFREDQPFFKWYGGLHRKMLFCFTHLFVQTPDSKKRLVALSLSENVTVSGDTRFDRVTEIAEKWEPVPLISAFCGGHPVVVAGSTWPEDEEELDHYANTHPEVRFIVAPHEISEEHLKDIERLFKYSVRYSQLLSAAQSSQMSPDERGDSAETKYSLLTTHYSPANTLIIDNIGMLSQLYKYATVSYIGGGFGDDGVHNVLEAAVYDKPVVHGPEYHKYREAVDLVEAGGAFSVNNALKLETILDSLLQEANGCAEAGRAAGKYVYANKGATDSILRYIQEKRLLTS